MSDGRVRLTFGDGECELPANDDLAHLCRAMHRSFRPLTPQTLYHCVTSGCRPEESPAEDWCRALALRGLLYDTEGEDFPHSLCDVAQCVVSAFWTRPCSETFGHPLTVLRFATEELAMEARRLDAEYNVGTADDVIRLLHLSQTRDTLRHVFGVVGIREPWEGHEEAPAQDNVMTTTMWTSLLHPITDVCASVSLCVLHRLFVYSMTFVHNHWVPLDYDPTRMEHRSTRLRGWTLRYVRHAVHGGHVELETPEEDVARQHEWPVWISEFCRRMPRLPVCAMTIQLPLDRYPSCTSPSWSSSTKRGVVDLDDIVCDQKCRKVISKWSKSQTARGAETPFLVRVRPLLDDGSFKSGTLTMRRESTEAEVRQSSLRVFTERFGIKYANHLVERCCDDDSCAIYSVYDGDELVGAFAVVLYDSVSSNGESSVCAMVDSFAVAKSADGRGYGGRIFHEGVRRVAQRHAGPSSSYTVFAQCVRTGDAYKFWFDKLDDSSTARSLVLQALSVDGMRVPIQSEAECAPRCREFRS